MIHTGLGIDPNFNLRIALRGRSFFRSRLWLVSLGNRGWRGLRLLRVSCCRHEQRAKHNEARSQSSHCESAMKGWIQVNVAHHIRRVRRAHSNIIRLPSDRLFECEARNNALTIPRTALRKHADQVWCGHVAIRVFQSNGNLCHIRHRAGNDAMYRSIAGTEIGTGAVGGDSAVKRGCASG